MEKPEVALLTQLILDIKQDVAAVKADISETKEIALRNTVVLEEHARRSQASEDRLEVQEQKFEEFVKKMEPVQEHVEMVSNLTKAGLWIAKAIGVVASAGAAVIGLLKALR